MSTHETACALGRKFGQLFGSIQIYGRGFVTFDGALLTPPTQKDLQHFSSGDLQDFLRRLESPAAPCFHAEAKRRGI